jgi:hypothetical protein
MELLAKKCWTMYAFKRRSVFIRLGYLEAIGLAAWDLMYEYLGRIKLTLKLLYFNFHITHLAKSNPGYCTECY